MIARATAVMILSCAACANTPAMTPQRATSPPLIETETGQKTPASTQPEAPNGNPNRPTEQAPRPPEAELLIGYLSRDPVTHELLLDTPHEDQGAVRYVLSGDLVNHLTPALGLSPVVATQGDLQSDGDTRKTMKVAAGGMGCKRSELRFSSVLAAVEGTVQVIVKQAPNDAYLYRRDHGKDLDPRLPQGGVLRSLTLTKLRFTLSTKEWRILETQTLLPLANKASYNLHRQKVDEAGIALQEIAEVVVEEYGEAARKVRIVDELSRAAAPLRDQALTPRQACQKAAAVLSSEDVLPNRIYKVLRKGFGVCSK